LIAGLPRHGVGGGAAVARQHDGMEPARLERRHDRAGIRTHGVGDGKGGRQPAVNGDEYNGPGIGSPTRSLTRKRCHVDLGFAHQHFGPGHHCVAVDHAAYTFAGDRAHLLYRTCGT
jgi:hypothetical protein